MSERERECVCERKFSLTGLCVRLHPRFIYSGFVFAHFARRLGWSPDASVVNAELVNRLPLRGKDYPLLLQSTPFVER